MSKTTQPEVLWAQRSSADDAEKNIVYLTIMAPDVEKPKLDITSTGIKYSGSNKEREYHFELEFFAEIEPAKTQERSSSRSTFLVLQKKELKAEFWPRLSKEKAKLHYLKTDFDKWVDEDEQDGGDDVDLGGMNPFGGAGGGGMPPGMGGMGGGGDLASMMQGMGGMGGMGGMPGMPEGMDLSQLAAMAGQGGEDDEGEDDDDLPELEEATKDELK